MRAALESGDVKSIAATLGADLKSRHDAVKVLHMARTKAESVPMVKRLYSHAWLESHGLPSLLPDKDRPSKVTRAVGVAVNSYVSFVKNALTRVQEEAILSAYADGVKDHLLIRRLMAEARARELRGLELKLGERAK